MENIVKETLQTTKLGDDILDYYKSIDCKYFVLNVEDLVSCLDEDELDQFLDTLDKYNAYRNSKNKSIRKYFILHRNDFPDFENNALAFVNWVKEIYHYGKY